MTPVAHQAAGPMGLFEPLLIGLVGASAPQRRGLAQALANRIAAETGWRVAMADGPPGAADDTLGVRLCDEITATGLSETDFVLVLAARDEPPRAGDCWREQLLAASLPWASLEIDGADAADRALDAVAPLLRRCSPPRDGLFTRLALRNAEHASWRWVCQDCDVPECEHALRVTPMDSRAGSR